MPRGTYAVDVEKIKRLAFDKGWSLNVLAFHADIGPLTFHKWSIGRKAYPHTVAKVAAALEVKPSELIKE